MIFLRSNGLRIAENTGNLPEEFVYVAEPLKSGPNFGKVIGNGSLALGISEILSSANIANPIDYIEGKFSNFTDNTRAQEVYDSQFRTLGNGKLELNDILAFPVNFSGRIAENIKSKITGKPKRPLYGTEEYVKMMKEKVPDYEPQGSENNDLDKYGKVVKKVIDEIKKGAGYGEAR